MTMSHFKERIEEAQKSVDSLRTDVAELMGMAEAEERDLSDDESLQLEEYAKQIEAGDKRIADLERAEKAMAARVVEKQAPAVIKQAGHKERKPGELHIKHATAAFVAHLERKSIDRVAQEIFPRDQGLQAVIKTAIDPADTTTSGWATELTEEANRGYLELLRGASMAAQVWPSAGVNLQFDGYTALNIPSRAGSVTDLASGWTPEGGAIPVRKATFASQRIEPYKWAAIVTMTREITQRSVPGLMGIIQQGLVQDTATKLDADYFGTAAAVPGFNPRGIFEGVAGVPASSGGATAGDDMLQDLRNLVDPIYAANMGQMLYIFMHPSNALSMGTVLYNGTYLFRDELARGTLLGIPVIQSTNAPTDEIWAVDMAQQAVARGAMRFDVSDTATIVEYDDNTAADPHMDAGAPRSPNTGTVSDAINATDAASGLGNVRSLFQTETVAIRTIQDLSWATLRTGSVNKITGVAY
jgi:HK97 family phage major capsid protein